MRQVFNQVSGYIRSTQIWNSVFRHGIPRDRRTRVMAVMGNVFLHLHPVAIRKSGVRLSFTWCMGGLTFFLFLAEAISGILLMFYYRPVPEYAYADIISFRAHVTLGLLREIHRWGAHALSAGAADTPGAYGFDQPALWNSFSRHGLMCPPC